MNKKIKIIGFSVLAIVIIAVAVYNYILYGGARNLSNEETVFTVTSKGMMEEFTANIDAGNKKYLDKAISISGTITSISGNEVILDNSIICILKDSDTTLRVNQAVTLKGRVVGYDDLMGEIKLDQCIKTL